MTQSVSSTATKEHQKYIKFEVNSRPWSLNALEIAMQTSAISRRSLLDFPEPRYGYFMGFRSDIWVLLWPIRSTVLTDGVYIVYWEN